jgi:hypothetical protein
MLGGNLAMVNIAQAFDMGNMMSPGKWFGDNDDDRPTVATVATADAPAPLS